MDTNKCLYCTCDETDGPHISFFVHIAGRKNHPQVVVAIHPMILSLP